MKLVTLFSILVLSTISYAEVSNGGGSDIGNANDKTFKVVLTAKKAESLAAALMKSGFVGDVKNGTGSLKVEQLSLGYRFNQAECNDEQNAQCGFEEPSYISTATQHGANVETKESIQLAQQLDQSVEPILTAKHIVHGDAAMGQSYNDYGSISCSWKVVKRQKFEIKNAVCTVLVPIYEM